MRRLVQSWWRPAVALTVVGMLALVIFAFVPIKADITVLLPDRQNDDTGLLFRTFRKGPANRVILLGLEPSSGGDRIERPDVLSRAYKAELLASGRFEQVANGEVVLDRTVLQALFDNRYLLNPPVDETDFSAAALRTSLEAILTRLHGLSAPLVEAVMVEDPTLRSLQIAEHWAPANVAAKKHGVWVSGDGLRVLFIARAGGAGFDFAAYETMANAASVAAKQLQPTFGSLRVTLSGPSVIAMESRRVAENESRRLMLISIPLVIGLLLLFFRRVAFVSLSILPLTLGFLFGTSAVAAIFGFVHVTTLGFGVTLIGVAVDYPIHLLTRTRPETSPLQAARQIRPKLLLGAATTIIGLLPLALSNFPGVAQLGVFTAAGLAVAAAFTLWGLPYLIASPKTPMPLLVRWIPRNVHALLGLGRIPILVVGVASVALLATRGQDLWQKDLAALSPISGKLLADDQLLRRDLSVANPRYLITIRGATEEEVLQRSEALLPHLNDLQAAGALDGFDLAARYMPSIKEQKTRSAALPGAGELRTALAEAQEGLPFKPGVFEPFVQAVTTAKNSKAITVSDLPATALRLYLESLLFQGEKGYLGLVTLRELNGLEALRGTLRRADLAGVRFMDLKQSTQDLMDKHRDETLTWVAIGAGLAFLVLLGVFRSVRSVVRVATPVVISVFLAAVIVAHFSGGLSLFHLLALLMVAGLGIDYTLFLRRNGLSISGNGESDAVGLRAVCLCAATTLTVSIVLSSSSVVMISQMGTIVAIGSTLSFVLGLIFAAPSRE